MYMNKFKALKAVVTSKLSSLGSQMVTRLHSMQNYLISVIFPKCRKILQDFCSYMLTPKVTLPPLILIFGLSLIIVLLNFSLRLALITLINAWVLVFLNQ